VVDASEHGARSLGDRMSPESRNAYYEGESPPG
jgi:hypothetical protein